MSAGKQPGTQIKLSIVRLKKAGKRFEVRSPLSPSLASLSGLTSSS